MSATNSTTKTNDPSRRQKFAQKAERDAKEKKVVTSDSSGDSKLLQPEEVMIQKDEEGNPEPIEAPLIGHPMLDAGDRHIFVYPIPLPKHREHNKMLAEYERKKEEGFYEEDDKGFVRDHGEDVVGLKEFPYELMKDLLNNHLHKPDVGKFRTPQDFEQHVFSIPMILSVVTTIRVYGSGMEIVTEDKFQDQVRKMQEEGEIDEVPEQAVDQEEHDKKK